MKLLLAALLVLSMPMAGRTQEPEDLPIPKTELRAAIGAQERHTEVLMLDPNVVGTAVGATARGQGVVKIFVKDARKGRLPRVLDGIPVEIEQTGEIVALRQPVQAEPLAVDRTSRFPRPVPLGVSTGHPDITAGTIAARVTAGGKFFALSNNHVYANSNAASIGDNVLQPGTYDGGVNPDDAIGTLFDYQPIDFSPFASNVVDAAIAVSSTADLGNATPADGYGTPNKALTPAAVGLRVMKYGRTTGLTKGRVTAINATVNVNYGPSGTARFVKQIVISPGSFSAGGDSGSLIVVERSSDARQPVGLLFAGSASVTIANPIGAVLERFGVSIDGP
jgi:hypothetical protein